MNIQSDELPVLCEMAKLEPEHLTLCPTLETAFEQGAYEKSGPCTFPLRMERQRGSACWVPQWLTSQPRLERVCFAGDPGDARAGKNFQFMDRSRMIMRATSLGTCSA